MTAPLAFLGLGRMGRPMAARLLMAGHPVAAWNRSAEVATAWAQTLPAQARARLAIASSAADAVERAEGVITMLSDGPAVDSVIGNIKLAAGTTLIDMSSVPPSLARALSRDLGALGVAMLDAPVSGGVVGAEAGTLAIMVGGDAATLGRWQAVLGTLGRVTHVGPAGSGQLAKLANQVIVGVTIGAVAEALLLAAHGGADAGAVRQAIRGGFAESRILELHGERMLQQRFEPGGAVATQRKDLATAVDEARAAGLDLPITRLLLQLFQQAAAHGDAALDHSALIRELARHNGLALDRLLAGS